MNESEGGFMLALFAAAGLPLAFGIPIIASRMANVANLVYVGAGLTIAGALGLAFAPTVAPYLWAFIFGSGPLLFPLALALINFRTKSSNASLQLSAFAQFVAYSIAATVAPLMGLSRAITGNWHVALVGIACSGLAAVWAGTVLSRNHSVESELAD